MSTTVNYLINGNDPLCELGKRISNRLGCNLVVSPDDPKYMSCWFLSMQLSLSTHDYANDGECDFENYRYDLGLRIPAASEDLRIVQVETAALLAYLLYRREFIEAGMLVYNLQIPLARYKVIEDQWFDQVSAKAVQFPQHFIDLRERIASWRQRARTDLAIRPAK